MRFSGFSQGHIAIGFRNILMHNDTYADRYTVRQAA